MHKARVKINSRRLKSGLATSKKIYPVRDKSDILQVKIN